MAKRTTKLQQLQKSGPAAKSGRVTETVCDDFLDYLRGECHLADNTIAAYGRDMRKFVDWVGKQRLSDLTVGDLSNFVSTLHEQGLAPASVARNVVAIRTFFKYLQLEGILRDNPAELIETQKMWQRMPGVLSPTEVDSFLSAPKKSDSYYLRDVAILEVLYATGCRASEVCALRVRDLSLKQSDRSNAKARAGNNGSYRSVCGRLKRSNGIPWSCEGFLLPRVRIRPRSCFFRAADARLIGFSCGDL